MKTRRQKVRMGILVASFILFPVTIFYFSPYLIVFGAFQGVAAGSMLVFALQLVSAMLLGRAWCGWACPAGGLQDMESTFADKPAKLGRRLAIKWAIWVPWMFSIIIGAIFAGGISTFDFFFHTENGLSVASPHGLAIYLAICALFFIPNLFFGKRAMCQCICWMAPFLIIGEKLGRLLRLPQLHVSAAPESCVHCGLCAKTCPMSLPVEELMSDGAVLHNECIQCGACCDACKKDALRLEFGAVDQGRARVTEKLA
ncbi:MAG: 4Fe-4S binding protein [Coriobacteriales bacterium]